MKIRILPVLLSVILIFVMAACKPKPGNSSIKLYPIEDNGLQGFIDENGKVVIDPKYLKVTEFSEGLSAVVIDTVYRKIADDSVFSIDPSSPITNPQLKWMPKNTTYLYVKYGYINPRGQFVISPNLITRFAIRKANEYNNIPGMYDYFFSDGLAVVMDTTNKFGFMDVDGSIVIPCKFKEVNRFEEGKAVVSTFPGEGALDESNCFGVIDKKGNSITKFHYYHIPNYHLGRTIAMINTRGVETEDDGTILFPNYSLVLLDQNGFELKEVPLGNAYYAAKEYTDDGIARMAPYLFSPSLTGWRYVDTDGQLLEPSTRKSNAELETIFSEPTRLAFYPEETNILDCTPFSEGFAAVTADSARWVFVDKYFIIRGNGENDFLYESAGEFQNGLAPVKRDEKWGYINTSFENVIPYQYSQANSFDGALAMVFLVERDSSRIVSSYINRFGDVVWQKVTYKGEKVNNTYSQKSVKDYGKWIVP